MSNSLQNFTWGLARMLRQALNSADFLDWPLRLREHNAPVLHRHCSSHCPCSIGSKRQHYSLATVQSLLLLGGPGTICHGVSENPVLIFDDSMQCQAVILCLVLFSNLLAKYSLLIAFFGCSWPPLFFQNVDRSATCGAPQASEIR